MRCSEVHSFISSTFLRAVFRRDWDIAGVQREGAMVWRVNPRSAKRIQRFIDFYLPEKWIYDGEAVLVQKEGKVHSVVLYGTSAEHGPALILISAKKETSSEIFMLLAELKARARRAVVSYDLDSRIEELIR